METVPQICVSVGENLMFELSFYSALPPSQNGKWNEEEVKRAAEGVTEFFKLPVKQNPKMETYKS